MIHAEGISAINAAQTAPKAMEFVEGTGLMRLFVVFILPVEKVIRRKGVKTIIYSTLSYSAHTS